MDNETIEKLLRENLEYNKKIFEIAKRTKRFILWSEIFSVIKVLVFVIPLVLAVIYAVPILREALATYNQLMESLNKAGTLPGQMPENILKSFLGN